MPYNQTLTSFGPGAASAAYPNTGIINLFVAGAFAQGRLYIDYLPPGADQNDPGAWVPASDAQVKHRQTGLVQVFIPAGYIWRPRLQTEQPIGVPLLNIVEASFVPSDQTTNEYQNNWQYSSAAGGIVNTTAVVIAAAAGAGLRNYISGLQIQNNAALVGTDVQILDGATVIWRGFTGGTGLFTSALDVDFPIPLRSSANSALSVKCGTTAAAVYVNAQGFIAP